MALLTSVILCSATITHSIPIRQDPNMSVNGSLLLNPQNLSKTIEELSKELNDTALERVSGEFASNISAGNYTAADELLNEIRNYLKERYGDKVLAPNAAAQEALINAAEVGEGGSITVNITELLKEYAELTKNKELMDAVMKLASSAAGSVRPSQEREVGEALAEIMKYVSREQQGLNVGKAAEEVRISPNASFIRSLPNIQGSIPNLPVPRSSAPGLEASLTYVIAFSAVAVIAALILSKWGVISGGVRLVKARIAASFRFKGAMPSDPLVRAYASLIKHLRILGIPKKPWETPNEYFRRVGMPDVKDTLRKVTEAYVKRVYGGKELPPEVVEEIVREVNEVVKVEGKPQV